MNNTHDVSDPLSSSGWFGEWLKIGSEPKDGTRFLAYYQGRVVDASWYCQVLCEHYPYSIRPTHWMPMPPPPNTKT